MIIYKLISSVLLYLTFFNSFSDPETRLPNIVLIFANDQGYADIGSYGVQGYSTPNLYRMAMEGVRFTK